MHKSAFAARSWNSYFAQDDSGIVPAQVVIGTK